MVALLVTEIEARDMQKAIQLFQVKDELVKREQHITDIRIAEAWFNSQNINLQSATTRVKAKNNFDEIEKLLQNSSDKYIIAVLQLKLVEANEKYIEVKRNV